MLRRIAWAQRQSHAAPTAVSSACCGNDRACGEPANPRCGRVEGAGVRLGLSRLTQLGDTACYFQDCHHSKVVAVLLGPCRVPLCALNCSV